MTSVYEYDVLLHFVNNLSPGFKTEVEQTWTKHLATVPRGRREQTDLLLEALLHATNAEKRVANFKDMVTGATTQVLIASGVAPDLSDVSSSGAGPSVLNSTPGKSIRGAPALDHS